MFPDPAPGRTSSTPLRLGAIYRSMGICEDDDEKWVSVWPKRRARDARPSRRDGGQNSALVNTRVHRPWYEGISDGQAASGRTDRSAPQLPPSLIAPSATLTPPGIRSPSTAIAGGDNATAGKRNGIPSGQAPGACRSWRFSGDWLHRSYIRGCCRPCPFPGRASLSVPCLFNGQRPGQARGWHAGTDITGTLPACLLSPLPGAWQRTRDDGLVEPWEGAEGGPNIRVPRNI